MIVGKIQKEDDARQGVLAGIISNERKDAGGIAPASFFQDNSFTALLFIDNKGAKFSRDHNRMRINPLVTIGDCLHSFFDCIIGNAPGCQLVGLRGDFCRRKELTSIRLILILKLHMIVIITICVHNF